MQYKQMIGDWYINEDLFEHRLYIQECRINNHSDRIDKFEFKVSYLNTKNCKIIIFLFLLSSLINHTYIYWLDYSGLIRFINEQYVVNGPFLYRIIYYRGLYMRYRILSVQLLKMRLYGYILRKRNHGNVVYIECN